MESDVDERLRHAMEELKDAISARVRAEQLRDQLTGLPNDHALTEWIQQQVDDGTSFWLAFVEVDQFKSINDQFGYDQADAMLRKIADEMSNAVGSLFSEDAIPYRAHGDEFFIGGCLQLEDEFDPRAKLDTLRSNIAGIEIATSSTQKMRCTVSIGWVKSSTARAEASDGGLTPRELKSQLECAVAQAKQQRNVVVMFSHEMRKSPTREGRTDCKACRAKFTVHVPVSDTHDGQLCCPNCKLEVDRPHALKPSLRP